MRPLAQHCSYVSASFHSQLRCQVRPPLHMLVVPAAGCWLQNSACCPQVVFADLATTPARVHISHARSDPGVAAGYSLLGEAALAAGKAGKQPVAPAPLQLQHPNG